MELYVADVTNKNDVEDMVQKIINVWGGIDIAINNAGGSQGSIAAVDELEDDTVSTSLLQLNVVGPHIVTSSVVRLTMNSDADDDNTCIKSNSNTDDNNGTSPAVRGQILNISSKAGKVGLPSMSFYVASKFALEV
jgi:NAD(P)-dependent dehydrogenase (short-subunit alcohol dehydrogenase family)